MQTNLRRYPTIGLASIAVIAAAMMTACAFDIVHVDQVPAALRAGNPATQAFVLDRDAPVQLPYGFRRLLKKGTTWRYVGTIASGDVFATRDQVLTVEASNIHEAYIVVSDGKLVGFFLPVEKTFSPAREATALPMRAVERAN